MKQTFKTATVVIAVLLAAMSCTKEIEVPRASEGSLNISIQGVINDLTPAAEVKATAGTVVRVNWEERDKVYVYDGITCLGALKVSLQDGDARYAYLSNDGDISAPTSETTKLTLVYASNVTQAPAVIDGQIKIDLSNQDGADFPFVLYGTLDYTSGQTTITDEFAPFKFATSVIKVNCTGLKANTAITSATLDNVNTKCKLTLSGSAAPTVSGDINGTITKTGDAYFAADKVNSEGEAVFQIAVPALETASEERVLTVAQGSDKVKDKNFSKKAIGPATSVNTVCQLVGLPAGALKGEFTVAAGKKVHFSQGNLVASIDASGAPTAWKFATNQYDYIGENVANTSIGSTAGDVDLFGWSTDAASNNWGIHTKTESTTGYTDGNFKDWGTAIDSKGTWRTLSKDEWTYLFSTRSNASKLYNYGVTVCGKTNCVVLLPDNWGWDESTVGTGWQTGGYPETATESNPVTWQTMQAAGAVCLPAAGHRMGSLVQYVGACGYYWSSSAIGSDIAHYVGFYRLDVSPNGIDGCLYGNSVRLITECQ